MYILKTLLNGEAKVSSHGVSRAEDERFNDCVRDFCEKIQRNAEEGVRGRKDETRSAMLGELEGAPDYQIYLEDGVDVVLKQRAGASGIYRNLPSKVLNYAELLYCDAEEEFNGTHFPARSVGFWMLGNNGKWIGISQRDGKLALGQIRESDIAQALQSVAGFE